MSSLIFFFFGGGGGFDFCVSFKFVCQHVGSRVRPWIGYRLELTWPPPPPSPHWPIPFRSRSCFVCLRKISCTRCTVHTGKQAQQGQTGRSDRECSGTRLGLFLTLIPTASCGPYIFVPKVKNFPSVSGNPDCHCNLC